MLGDQTQYRIFAQTKSTIPLFSQPWWLDITCGEENWGVSICKSDEEILGVMPYFWRKRLGMTILEQPILTQKLGPTIFYPSHLSYRKKLEFEKLVINTLILNLPDYHKFNQTCDHNLLSWLPFFWRGFSQTTQVSYVIDKSNCENGFLNLFSQSKRREVKKASKFLVCNSDITPDQFYDFHKSMLSKKGSKISYPLSFLERLEIADKQRDSHDYICVVDEDLTVYCALLLVWDSTTTYNLISVIDDQYKSSGASSLAVAAAIEASGKRGTAFDFEGSMQEAVEFSFRQFGAKQVQLSQVSHVNHLIMRIYSALRTVF